MVEYVRNKFKQGEKPMTGEENNKKLKNDIIKVVCIAAVIIVVAAVFVFDYVKTSKNEEEIYKQVSEQMDKKLEENQKKAGEIDEKRNLELVGNYVSGGDPNSTEAESTFISFTLSPDGTAAVATLDGATLSGWWVSDNQNGVELVAMGVEGTKDPVLYQVYDKHLIDIKSLYHGHVYKEPAFDTTFVSAHENGTMTINLTSDKKAKAEFIDTNEKSENYGLKYAYGGSYSSDGEYLNITLNMAETRFVMFDYNLNDGDKDSGIASIFYTKTK